METKRAFGAFLPPGGGSGGGSGAPGADGKSAYEIAVQNGFSGTVAEWLASLKGEPGAAGAKGEDGKSAYEAAVQNGFSGTVAEWIASLKGEPGAAGDKGEDGKSAYEVAVDKGFQGTVDEWIASLKGEPGEKGEPGAGGAVDDALSATSTNPVQNRVVLGALESMRTAMVGYLERLAAVEAIASEIFYIPVDEAGLSQSSVQADGVMEGVLASPYTFEEIYAQHEAGKLCAVRLSNTADGTKDVFLPLAFSGDAESVGSQGWSEHLYFDYAGGSVAQPTPMMMTVSVVKQTGGTKIYVTKTAITAGGGGSAYDDTELRAMIGDTAQLQTAAHELVGAINELQTGNVFPVVNPSKITSDPLVFLRASSNADEFWLYNINGYPGNPVDISAYVPAGSNSFYLRTDLIYSKKGEPVNPRGYTSTVECFMTDDGFASNPGQRSGVAYVQLYGGGTMTARVQYIPATGRLYMDANVQLAKEEELARRPVAYTLAVDEHFISPNISYGYSKTKEFLPGAQVDLEFWDTANFPADFDMDDPTTWPTPLKVYAGSVIGDDLTFTVNGVTGRYDGARNVVEMDLSAFPEYDAENENGSLYIHGTMVRRLDPALLPEDSGGGAEYAAGTETATGDWLTINGQRKQIYEKYIDCGTLTPADGAMISDAATVNHGITGLGLVLEASGTAVFASGSQYPMPVSFGDEVVMVDGKALWGASVGEVTAATVKICYGVSNPAPSGQWQSARCFVRLRYIKDVLPLPSAEGGGGSSV